MKVVDCSIKIESREEIDLLQNAIDVYLRSKYEVAEHDRKKLKEVKKQLEALWYGW